MSTRGIMGFVADGRTVLTYNHCDSYPEGLGVDLAKWAEGLTDERRTEVVAQIAAMEAVDDSTDPGPGEAAEVAAVLGGPEQVDTGTSWYAHLRSAQGDPDLTLAARYYSDAVSSTTPGTWAEWAYLVDFDRNALDVYRPGTEDGGRFTGLRRVTTVPFQEDMASALLASVAVASTAMEDDE